MDRKIESFPVKRKFHRFVPFFFIMFLPAVYAQQEDKLIREGNRLYKEKKFSEAEISYRKAYEKAKNSLPASFNLGDALYRQKKYEAAVDHFRRSANEASQKNIKSRSFHNLGNSYLQMRKLPESIEAYKEALRNNPDDKETKYNLAYAQALLKQQIHQENQQKQNNDQKKAPKNDNKQKQNQQTQNDQQQSSRQEQNRQSQISKQDADRILEALKNEEKNVQKKMNKKKPVMVQTERDW